MHVFVRNVCFFFFLHCRQVDRFDCSCVLYMRHSVIGRVVQCEIRECFDVITDDDDDDDDGDDGDDNDDGD